jgi:two-component system sensor histidine kinase/response regulator
LLHSEWVVGYDVSLVESLSHPHEHSLAVAAACFLVVATLLAGVAAAGEAAAPAAAAALTVVIDDNYPPYVFRAADGTLTGYLVDTWKLWEKATGVRVDLLGSDWATAQQRMTDGRAVVIDTAFPDFGARAYARFLVAL